MAPAQQVDTLIIGAGPTGLGAAWQLHVSRNSDNSSSSTPNGVTNGITNGINAPSTHADSASTSIDDWLLVDAADGPGGMAVTETDSEGFRWDYGGHVIHSHYQVFDDALAHHADWAHPRRGGWVRVQNAWCPTPIQRNLGSLAAGQQIVDELTNRGDVDISAVKDLGAYYAATFGPTLNDIFFAPFNRKQWGWPLAELSHTWTSLRSGSKAQNVPAPSVTSALTPQAGPEDVTTFPYPALGTGSLWHSVTAKLPSAKQRYGVSVDRLDLAARQAYLSDGSVLQYRRCISTIPLAELTALVAHERADLAALGSQLRYTSTYIVGFGFAGTLPPVLTGKTWVFAADAAVPFHRATILSNVSPALSGAGRWSIMFETSVSAQRELDVATLPDALLAELRRWGIDAVPASIWQRNLKYGYPLPFLGRDELLLKLLPEFEKAGVLPRGRFGGWRYESSNQDYAFAQGAEAVDFLEHGRPETVYWPARPGQVGA